MLLVKIILGLIAVGVFYVLTIMVYRTVIAYQRAGELESRREFRAAQSEYEKLPESDE